MRAIGSLPKSLTGGTLSETAREILRPKEGLRMTAFFRMGITSVWMIPAKTVLGWHSRLPVLTRNTAEGGCATNPWFRSLD